MPKLFLPILCAVMLLGAGCTSTVRVEPTDEPAVEPITSELFEFEFDFKYGVGARNEIDTLQGTFKKDMIADPSVTISLEFTEEEMSAIQQKIAELEIFEPVKTPAPEVTTFATPCTSYDLVVERGDVRNQLEWDCDDKGSNAKLDALLDFIWPMLESKEEFRNLPEARGGYL